MANLNNSNVSSTIVPATTGGIVRPIRANLKINQDIAISASADPKAAFDNAELSFPWQETLDRAKAGDIASAEVLAKHIEGLFIKISKRADDKIKEVLKAGGSPQDKAAASLRKERQYRLMQLELIQGQHDQSGHSVDGLIDEMKALRAANLSPVLDPQRWCHLEDQQVDKQVVSDKLNWNSLIRLLNGGGAQKFIQVEGNVIIRPIDTGFDFAYVKDGVIEHVVFNGTLTHSILMSMVEQQSMPFTQNGVLKSDGIPNLDGKTGVGTMQWITGDPADAACPVRFFCQDTLHSIMVRALLYAYDEQMFAKYEFDNGRLARFMGSNLFVAENRFDCDYYMARLTLEVNKKTPWKIKGYLSNYLKDVAPEVSQMFVTGADGKETFVYDNYKLTRLATLDGYYEIMDEVLAAKAAAAAAKVPATGQPKYEKKAPQLNLSKPGSAGMPTLVLPTDDDDDQR